MQELVYRQTSTPPVADRVKVCACLPFPVPAGFVSLNCGTDSTGSFVDAATTIPWLSDQTYISTGSAGQVSDAVQARELQSLRYFPLYRKNCYTFTVQPTFIYLVRAGFFYGNYDGQASKSITFSVRACLSSHAASAPSPGRFHSSQ